MTAFANLSFPAIMLASSDVAQVWGRFDHQRPTFHFGHFFLWSFVAAAIAGIALFILRTQRRHSAGFTSNSPTKLFRELCRAHKLARADRRLLKQLARSRNAVNPTLLFVEPRYFDTATLPAALRPKVRELQRLRDRLFG